MQKKSRNQGVLLIIVLLVLVVITAICLTMTSASVTQKKATTYSSNKLEAEQKANSILTFAISQINPTNANDITPCAMNSACLVWDNTVPIPAYAYNAVTADVTKNWWINNAQTYPNTTQLQLGSASAIAKYFINQEAVITNAEGKTVRTLRVVSYVTDSKATTVAVKQKMYTFTATAPPSPAGWYGCSNCETVTDQDANLNGCINSSFSRAVSALPTGYNWSNPGNATWNDLCASINKTCTQAIDWLCRQEGCGSWANDGSRIGYCQ